MDTNHLTAAAENDDEPTTPIEDVYNPPPSVVYLPPSMLPRRVVTHDDAATDLPENTAPVRTGHIAILHWQPPVMVVEATIAAAHDLRHVPGIKQIEPPPEEIAPDASGTHYFNCVVSLLFDKKALYRAVEDLNERGIVPDEFGVCEL